MTHGSGPMHHVICDRTVTHTRCCAPMQMFMTLKSSSDTREDLDGFGDESEEATGPEATSGKPLPPKVRRSTFPLTGAFPFSAFATISSLYVLCFAQRDTARVLLVRAKRALHAC